LISPPGTVFGFSPIGIIRETKKLRVTPIRPMGFHEIHEEELTVTEINATKEGERLGRTLVVLRVYLEGAAE